MVWFMCFLSPLKNFLSKIGRTLSERILIGIWQKWLFTFSHKLSPIHCFFYFESGHWLFPSFLFISFFSAVALFSFLFFWGKVLSNVALLLLLLLFLVYMWFLFFIKFGWLHFFYHFLNWTSIFKKSIWVNLHKLTFSIILFFQSQPNKNEGN